MNILSLFDGISCGQLALQKAGIQYNNYFASEIDKYSSAVTQTRFPNTIQLGDIKEWQKWDLPKIDMIIGGSPCQGFSDSGKGLNFKDPRSKLFFDFINVLTYYKPTYFLLENVRMKKEWNNTISEIIGVKPILINSNLVSAQNRRRLYWTNIPNIMQPKDKHILLQDILQKNVSHEYRKSTKAMAFAKRHNVKLSLAKKKANCLTTSHNKSGKQERTNDVPVGPVGKQYCLIEDYKPDSIKGYLRKNVNKITFYRFDAESSHYRIIKNARCINEKGGCITTECGNPTGAGQNVLFYDDLTWRTLTPLECERLQTIPDNYTLTPHPVRKNKMMSKSRRYKLIGNAWTVDVIAHIFSFI